MGYFVEALLQELLLATLAVEPALPASTDRLQQYPIILGGVPASLIGVTILIALQQQKLASQQP